MTNKREFNKYRKTVLKEIPYLNVYVDGIIETKQGYFTKTFIVEDGIMMVFNAIKNIYDSEETSLNNVDAQLTYFQGNYYLTLGVYKVCYEDAVEAFGSIKNTKLSPMSLIERLNLLHMMYQNDDSFTERFDKCAYRKPKKNEVAPVYPDLFDADYPVYERMKNFSKNKKVSKDLIMPMYMSNSATEMEFEGNYLRLFYFKNMPRYLTREFFIDIEKIPDVCFSIHFKPLNQQEIIQYIEDKYTEAKDLKDSDLVQKQFFDSAKTELVRSAKRGESMFLVTLVCGVYDDSIDKLNAKMKHQIREMECSYVIKELKFQQKAAFGTFLPYCEDNLDIQTAAYKAKVEVE